MNNLKINNMKKKELKAEIKSLESEKSELKREIDALVDEIILTWSKDRIKDFFADIASLSHVSTKEEILNALKELF